MSSLPAHCLPSPLPTPSPKFVSEAARFWFGSVVRRFRCRAVGAVGVVEVRVRVRPIDATDPSEWLFVVSEERQQTKPM